MKREPKRIPPSEWPAAWWTAILSVIASLPKRYRYFADCDYWRAWLLVSRDTNWPAQFLSSIGFGQIAPDGTVVLRRADHPVPVVVRLSSDTLAAIEPLRQTPRPDGRVLFPGTTWKNHRKKWGRIIRLAGFDPKHDEQIPADAAWPHPKLLVQPAAPPIQGQPQSLIQFLDHTYTPLRLCGKSDNTLRLYRISVRNFSRYLEREPMLQDLSDETVAAYLGWLRAKKYAPHTVQKEYCQLTAIWRFACQRRLIDLFPTVQKPKAPRTDPRSWLQADLNKLFKSIAETPGYVADVPAAAWWLALHYVIWNTGERIGAVLALKWCDIDLDGRWLIVRAEYRKGKGEDKTHAIADYTVAALRAIRNAGRSEVFPWPHDRTMIYHRYGQVLKRAGLPTDRLSKFHRLRRTVATQFELRGGDATKLLGHYDRSVTEGHYLDPRVVPRVQAIDLLPRPDAE